MPRYVQLEINDIREIAKRPVTNELNTREGTLRQTILRYMNDAEETLQGRLIGDIPDLAYFNATTEIPLVAGQRDYDLPGDVFGGGIMMMVEHSPTGNADDYAPILPRPQLNMYSGRGNFNFEFDAFAGKLRLSPLPDAAQGKVRLTYVRAIDTLDIRRGLILDVNDDGTNYTTIELTNDTTLESTGFANNDFICVVAADGSVVRYNLQFSSYNTGTRIITLAAGQAISGGTIAVGQYVTVGRYTRSHSQLPKNCDRFRLHYAALGIQMQTSNADTIMQDPKVASIYDDIELSFRKLPRGPRRIPIINPTYT